MKRECPHCKAKDPKYIKRGHFFRKSDSKRVQKYQCQTCGKYFSSATFSTAYRQNRRRLNPFIYKFLVSGVSQRRAARLLRCNLKTVARKLVYLSSLCEIDLEALRKSWGELEEVQLDEMETWEHTKLKALSIFVVVNKKTRKILSAKVSQMPTKGLIAKKSRKKYGIREDHRREDIFNELKKLRENIGENTLLESDESPRYPSIIRQIFPNTKHKTYKGRRGCVTGQGELKAVGFDPIFSLNHNCAMFRANVNRLFRKTWCTTKKKERLQMHLNLYMHYHNMELTK